MEKLFLRIDNPAIGKFDLPASSAGERCIVACHQDGNPSWLSCAGDGGTLHFAAGIVLLRLRKEKLKISAIGFRGEVVTQEGLDNA